MPIADCVASGMEWSPSCRVRGASPLFCTRPLVPSFAISGGLTDGGADHCTALAIPIPDGRGGGAVAGPFSAGGWAARLPSARLARPLCLSRPAVGSAGLPPSAFDSDNGSFGPASTGAAIGASHGGTDGCDPGGTCRAGAASEGVPCDGAVSNGRARSNPASGEVEDGSDVLSSRCSDVRSAQPSAPCIAWGGLALDLPSCPCAVVMVAAGSSWPAASPPPVTVGFAAVAPPGAVAGEGDGPC